MKCLAIKFLLVAALAASGAAQAVVCSVVATSVPLSTLYATGTATQVAGTISGTCTRDTGDVTRPYIYIGINEGEPPAGRAMVRQNGAETLAYQIYHRNYGQGIWNEGVGVGSNTNSTGGVLTRFGAGGPPLAFSFTYYVVIPTPQAGKPAGIYDDLAVGVTVRASNASGSATGAMLAQTSFGVSASIQHSCYFSSAPTPLSMNYTSFDGLPATGSSAFQLSCTYNSPYTLTIGPPANATLLGLNYSLALSASAGTGTGGPQNFSVNGTIPAGQSGSCATSSCSGSQVHTITVGF